MTELRDGWINVSLWDVAELHDNRRIPLNETQRSNRSGTYPYYGANGQVDSIDEYIFEGEHTLLAEDGGYFDHPTRDVAYNVTGQFWVNNHAHILSTRDEIPQRFLTYLLNSIDWMPYVSGTTRLKLSQAGMSRVEIPLPPLPEQRRIVAKLDALFSRTRLAREELQNIPILVEHYKQALLGAAYNRAAESENQIIPLGELVTELRNGVGKPPKNHPPGISILKISAVRPMTVRMNERRYYILDKDEDITRYALKSGDLLFTRYNGNPEFVANCGMIREADDLLIYPDKLIRVRLDTEKVSPAFVEVIVSSPQARDALSPFIKSAAGQHGISGSDLKRLPLPIPSLPIQQEIVDLVTLAFSRIDQASVESLSAQLLLDHLEKTILKKAFRGELVPQDSNDEPASVLLERIRKVRAEQSNGSKRKKRQ